MKLTTGQAAARGESADGAPLAEAAAEEARTQADCASARAARELWDASGGSCEEEDAEGKARRRRRAQAEPGRVTAGRSGVARAADQSGDKEGYCASRER